MLQLNITNKEKNYGLLLVFIVASQSLPAFIYLTTTNYLVLFSLKMEYMRVLQQYFAYWLALFFFILFYENKRRLGLPYLIDIKDNIQITHTE